jgi:uncharacterized oxidoreductase
MEISGNTVLITGGATGIGFALAEAFLNARNDVIICGRRKHKLQEAKRKLPGLHVKSFDVSNEHERESLLRWVTSTFSNFNILVNNAGIQREVDFTSPSIAKPVRPEDDEVTINLIAPIRLCALFTPKLLKKKAAIVNISSGLAFVPIAMMPVYCATKAAIHSFTISLRHQLRDTSVQVFEAAPPTTDTELDRAFAGEEEEAYRGISPREVAAAILQGMQADTQEIIIGEAKGLYKESRRNPETIFKQLNG